MKPFDLALRLRVIGSARFNSKTVVAGKVVEHRMKAMFSFCVSIALNYNRLRVVTQNSLWNATECINAFSNMRPMFLHVRYQ